MSVCQEVIYCDYVATRHSEELTARAPSFELRPLTDDEIAASVLEQEMYHEIHQIYVTLVADQLPPTILALPEVTDAIARYQEHPAEPSLKEALRRGSA